MKFEEAVKEAVKACAPLEASHVSESCNGDPVLLKLFNKDNVILRSGKDERWTSMTDSYEITDRELAGFDKGKLLAVIGERRGPTLIRLAKAFRQLFFDTAGRDADYNKWRAVVLKGWWLRESSFRSAGERKTTVFIDSVLYFELKH